jgi:hypothetical protein
MLGRELRHHLLAASSMREAQIAGDEGAALAGVELDPDDTCWRPSQPSPVAELLERNQQTARPR